MELTGTASESCPSPSPLRPSTPRLDQLGPGSHPDLAIVFGRGLDIFRLGHGRPAFSSFANFGSSGSASTASAGLHPRHRAPAHRPQHRAPILTFAFFRCAPRRSTDDVGLVRSVSRAAVVPARSLAFRLAGLLRRHRPSPRPCPRPVRGPLPRYQPVFFRTTLLFHGRRPLLSP